MMKKTIVTIACTLIALVAFAQPGSNGTKNHRTNNGNGNASHRRLRTARLPITSPPKRSSFARITRITRAVMFSTGLVTL